MIIPLPIDPDYKTNKGRIKITPPIIPLIIPTITMRDPACELFSYTMILATFVDIDFQQRLIILLFQFQIVQQFCNNFFMEEKSNDKDKDVGASKLQRLLSSHSLQGLVYQKRQRKQTHTVNPFNQLNIKTPQTNKKKIVKTQKQRSKKIIKAQKKQQKAQKKSPSKPKSKSKQKVVKKVVKKSEKNKKDDQNTKKRGRPKKQIKQQQPEKSQQNDIVPENKQQIEEKQIDRKQQLIQRIKQEQQESQQQQVEEEEQNASQQSEEEQQEQQYSQKKKSTNIKQIARNLKQKQKQLSESVGDKQKLNEPEINNKQLHQPSKIVQNKNLQSDNTIAVQHIASITNLNEQIKQPEHQIQIKKKVYGRPKKVTIVNPDDKSIPNDHLDNNKNEEIAQQNQKIQSEQEKEKQSQVKRTLRIRRRFNTADIPQINDQKKQQDHQSEKQCSNPRKRRLRLRKTKDQAVKKFNMFEGFSQDQQNQNYQIRKRKGISDKQYQINRIFRKTQRVNLPNVKLDVDIMTFSLENFISKFKSFDLIHCSLPLDMLIRLPSIGNLINKGFIFIWVEKGQIQIGYHWLSRIGFDVIDQIMWVKTNQTVSQVKCDSNSQSQIFPNCRSTCLVGYKCSSNQKTEYCTKISNNLIFSVDRPATIQKPDEIYQIGDLMMPGARKLQIGFKQLGGWFTLKHVQPGLIRCYQCLRTCRNSLLLTQNKKVLCKYCIENNIDKQNKEQEQKQANQQLKKKQKEQKNYPLRIEVKKYQQYPQIQCEHCKKTVSQSIIHKNEKKQQNIEQKTEQIFYCKNCYPLSEQIKQITVFNRQQVYFPKKYITCTHCNKMCLYKYYFECSTCKNDHNLCSKCFYETNPPKSQPENKNQQKEQNPVEHKNEIKIHDWKLKFLYEQPDTRVACFECNQQCAIPYWGCQTCQSWYWCGRCKSTQIPKAHQHHCHYNREHYLHLII